LHTSASVANDHCESASPRASKQCKRANALVHMACKHARGLFRGIGNIKPLFTPSHRLLPLVPASGGQTSPEHPVSSAQKCLQGLYCSDHGGFSDSAPSLYQEPEASAQDDCPREDERISRGEAAQVITSRADHHTQGRDKTVRAIPARMA
jgi:hypothetical protein